MATVRERCDTFVGTANYLSPEVVKRSNHSLAIDIWALGLIFLKMLTGKPAFPGKKHEDIFGAIRERKIMWPEERKDFLEPMRLTEAERDLIDKMM